MHCPKCGAQNSDGVEFCAVCGASMGSVGDGGTFAPLAPERDSGESLLGQTLNNQYRLDAVLGRGGMGIVYRAHDTLLDQPCALKMIHPDLVASEEARRRFLNEARVAVTLEHPHIVRTRDPFLWDNRVCLKMELLEGEGLRALATRHSAEDNPLEWERAESILTQIGEAITHAHGMGLAHRDLKPENVFLAERGAVVLDFGLVKRMDGTQMTRTGATMGTYMYMAPEQRDGGKIDARVDVYSIGMMAYELLCGRLPGVRARGPEELRDDLPAGVDDWVFRALEESPDQRFADAGAQLAALRSLGSDSTRFAKEREIEERRAREAQEREQAQREADRQAKERREREAEERKLRKAREEADRKLKEAQEAEQRRQKEERDRRRAEEREIKKQQRRESWKKYKESAESALQSGVGMASKAAGDVASKSATTAGAVAGKAKVSAGSAFTNFIQYLVRASRENWNDGIDVTRVALRAHGIDLIAAVVALIATVICVSNFAETEFMAFLMAYWSLITIAWAFFRSGKPIQALANTIVEHQSQPGIRIVTLAQFSICAMMIGLTPLIVFAGMTVWLSQAEMGAWNAPLIGMAIASHALAGGVLLGMLRRWIQKRDPVPALVRYRIGWFLVIVLIVFAMDLLYLAFTRSYS